MLFDDYEFTKLALEVFLITGMLRL